MHWARLNWACGQASTWYNTLSGSIQSNTQSPSIIVLVQDADQLTLLELKFVFHGWVEIKLDSVNSRVGRACRFSICLSGSRDELTSSSSNGGTRACLDGCTGGFRRHAEFGSGRTWRTHERTRFGEIHGSWAILTLGSSTLETNRSNSSDNRGLSWHFNNGRTRRINRINVGVVSKWVLGWDGLGVVSKWILSVV